MYGNSLNYLLIVCKSKIILKIFVPPKKNRLILKYHTKFTDRTFDTGGLYDMVQLGEVGVGGRARKGSGR